MLRGSVSGDMTYGLVAAVMIVDGILELDEALAMDDDADCIVEHAANPMRRPTPPGR